MSIDILEALNTENMREIFLKYTRKAFEMLPKMKSPRILDIGCGTGSPTIELAKLTDGEVIGIDIDQTALYKFRLKIKKNGLTSRIKTFDYSIYNTNFPNESFDLIWDEGVIHILDVKKCLKECNRVLRSKGFLVIGETLKWIKNNLEVFPKHDFALLNKFPLPEGAWWTEYYSPLEEKIEELKLKLKGSKELKRIESHENEIAMVKSNPKEFDCGFYIFQKSE
jgi:ubiquinone/menaquinone biosynthesis C-methylase UbiE